MTAGLQIWNGSGGLVLDATHRIGKVLAVLTVTAGSSGSWSGDLTSGGRTGFAAFSRAFTYGSATNQWYVQKPEVVVSGNTVTWTYGSLSGSQSVYCGGIIVIGWY
ncbi:hypothetical protein [Paraburkholderia sp. J8-2]|uniref:hypothetical protein n=1 Tax=Paraburkholderia sp. J8-2 TaxID=2805440 RepID=UPI002AB667F5|nr:hypothetical protein [Paraburkholderia sp. J8-2]